MKKLITFIIMLGVVVIGYSSVFAKVDKSALDKASEIVKEFPTKVTYAATNGNEIIIDKVSNKDSHIEVFVRAWKDKDQYGFGKDGSVETERLRVFNPPILVPDGTTHEWCDAFGDCSQVNNYKEDPEAALKSIVEDMVRTTGTPSSKSIIRGSVGNTVTVIYPASDGLIFKNNSSDWATTRSASAGEIVGNSVSSDTYPMTGHDGSPFIIGRSFFTFDTSVIGSDQLISSAVFSQYQVGTNRDIDNDGNDYIVFVASTQASTSTLVLGDFDQIGDTAFTSTIDIGSISANTYNDFTFNATGKANINTSGYTQIAGREGHDYLDDPFSGSSNQFNSGSWYFSQQSGTTNDPKLTITHTAGAPTAPTSLLTEGFTNPTAVTDATPEFSAVYNDPNSTDTSTWYKIQVATSTLWSTSSIFWDSGRLQMATTTVGSSSPDLSYAGNALTASTTYYWRIKFWDQANLEGAWSTATSTFVLAPTPSGYTAVIIDIDYAPTGKASFIEYANGVKTTYTYDPGKLYRLINIYTGKY